MPRHARRTRAPAAGLLPSSHSQPGLELSEIGVLQSISSELIDAHRIEVLYERIVDAATRIMHSDYASMQMLYPERGTGGELRLLAFRGFNPEAAKFWEWVRADSKSTCGLALLTGRRAVAPDISSCEFMADSDDQQIYLQTGIHACQTTPLIARDGTVVGMISTHWRTPHLPSDRDFRLFDILVRQAADLIERTRREQQAQERAREQEEQLRKTEKIAAAGQLAASLAHEINNPLTSVTNLLYLLQQRSDLHRDARNLLSTAEEELARVAHIVKQSLSYYRPGTAASEVDLAALVEDSLRIFSDRVRRAGVRLKKKVAPSACIVGFANEVRQAVDNLLVNALEATPAGGHLAISVRYSADWSDPNQKGVRITIADSGCGVRREDLARIFDPFFTTKNQKGTGLGLWVVRGIVGKHGAIIRVRSTTTGPRTGTVVSVLWRCTPQTSQVRRSRSESAA